ncbi:alpha/beta hydrolase family protein [Paenibacillus sp. GYB003]|uniref:alpha/beta hydrolase family protein n=1 Tax=Paenibacillus sp. GYB003 TaxID=2994392 RepID=UPI003FA7C4DF
MIFFSFEHANPTTDLMGSGKSILIPISRKRSWKNRIGIIGHSFGGYSTLAAMTKIPEFKAAVISAGRERYIRNSPLFDLDKIEAPVLIIQGIRDHLCRNEAGPLLIKSFLMLHCQKMMCCYK